jgi:hypothetical protein
MKRKKELEIMIKKSEKRLFKLREMKAPEEFVRMEIIHLAKLIEARVKEEK